MSQSLHKMAQIMAFSFWICRLALTTLMKPEIPEKHFNGTWSLAFYEEITSKYLLRRRTILLRSYCLGLSDPGSSSNDNVLSFLWKGSPNISWSDSNASNLSTGSSILRNQSMGYSQVLQYDLELGRSGYSWTTGHFTIHWNRRPWGFRISAYYFCGYKTSLLMQNPYDRRKNAANGAGWI